MTIVVIVWFVLCVFIIVFCNPESTVLGTTFGRHVVLFSELCFMSSSLTYLYANVFGCVELVFVLINATIWRRKQDVSNWI